VESELIHFPLFTLQNSGDEEQKKKEADLVTLVAVTLSLRWTVAILLLSSASLCFFSSSVFLLPLLTMFLPSLQWLHGGVAGGNGGEATMALLLSSVSSFPLPCYFFHFLLLFLSSSRSCFPSSIFFFCSSSLFCISNNSSFPLFLYIFAPCSSLSPGIYKEEKGGEGYYPCLVMAQG
jgi:hypothetical protein